MSGFLARLPHAVDVLVHLVIREWISRQRFTLLGWGWPLLRQLVQVAVLAFLFGRALNLGIKDYALFVFSGSIAWSLFSAGANGGTWSLVQHRHLLLQPRTPAPVIPLVGVLTPALDFLVALPLVIALLYAQGHGLHVSALLAIPMLGIQLLLTAGIAWLTSAVAVVFRDMTAIVETSVFTLFYLTPVFYGLDQVPEHYREILRLNPIGVLIQAYRRVLLDGRVPSPGPVLAVLALALVVAAVGYLTFERLRPTFIDRL